MITVTHIPGDNNWVKTFDTEADFSYWLVQYLCVHCYEGIVENRRLLNSHSTLSDFLNTRCGVELAVEGLKRYS